MSILSELRWRKPRTTWLLWHAAVLLGILSLHCGAGADKNVSARSPVQPELDDAVVIEAGKSSHDVSSSPGKGSRKQRQLFPGFAPGVFPAGWPFVTNKPISISPQLPQFPNFPQFPAGIHLQPSQPTHPPLPTHPPQPEAPTHPPSITGPCLTNNGLTGYCASFRQCYPILYSPDDGHIMNNGLAEMYMNVSGPCHTNFFIFRADAQLRQNQICCSGNFPSIGYPPYYPQITMRPPSAVIPTTTTTTTTPRPQTHPTWAPWQTTQNPWTQPTITTTTTTIRPQTHPPWVPWQTTQNPWTQPTTTTTTTTRRPQTHPTYHWQTTNRNPWTQPPQPVTDAPPAVQSSCGVGKIVGGSPAQKGEFPWLIAIVRNGRQVCGGSLIDSQFILTAAHCFNGVNGHELQSLFKVYIGDYDLHSLTDGPMTVKSISKLIVHRSFHQQYFYNDIALLKLDSPVQFGNNGNNNIRPICLSNGGNYEGQSAVVAGWGRTSAQNTYQPGIYRKVELTIWNLQQCAAKYGSSAPGGITSQMMCAGVTNKDSCLGDSGGPLMRLNGNVWEQIGIVSWGIGCGTYPGVYTRVADYQDWISRNRHS